MTKGYFSLLIAGWAVFIASAFGTVRAAAPLQPAAITPASDRAVLDRYCVTCHNEKLRTGGLTLDTADVTNVAAGAEVWEKVIRKLQSGAMPPPGRPRPDPAARTLLISHLETSLDHAAAAHPNPGRTETLHRLNRTEYHNAVKDLLAFEIDDSLLPNDEAGGSGFDNIASGLSASPALLERYMSAARKISRLAVGVPPKGPVVDTYKGFDINYPDDSDRQSEDLPFGSRGGLAIRHYFPVDGEYLIKVHLQASYLDYYRGLDTPHQLEIRLDGAPVKQFTVGGKAAGKPAPLSYAGKVIMDAEWQNYMKVEAGAGLEVRLPVKAGPRIVGVAFVREQWEHDGILQPRIAGHALSVSELGNENPEINNVVISGPHSVSGPGDTPSRREIFVCQPKRAAEEQPCARTIVSRLARRAYRRPITDDDVSPLMGFYEKGRREGSFDSGVEMMLESLLVDPDFLFRVERDPASVKPNTPYHISNLELASRLSFFLWSSIPDEELLDVAARGQLTDPAVLDHQVRRMLGSRRAAKALVSNFAGQWLLLRNIRSMVPDPVEFPEYDDNLREAFQHESELFLEYGLREDRSVLDLLSANYTFANERLAKHYGIPNVYGSRFRRVTLPDSQRGGLLGHGGLLTVTSYPNRTSPVLRGKWLLENILGTPPPPPPPNVPALPDTGNAGQPASVRERLEQHRKNPVCAACHAAMDPLGFALENFDGIGTWRTRDGETTIDPSGSLPNGATLKGPAELRTVLLGQREQFVRTVTEKLLMYSLGREIEFYDQPAIRKIATEAAASDYRWSAIILGIAKSAPFQMRRSES